MWPPEKHLFSACWLFCLLWRCRFLRFVERPRGDPLGRSAAVASTAVAVASSAGSVLPSFTSISFMGALEAVAGAAPALSAFAPWAAWVESSAGFGVSSVFIFFSSGLADVALGSVLTTA